MLKALRKFVLERRSDANRTKPQVVEDDHPSEPESASEAPAEVVEPPHEELVSATVLGKVKWYNSNKRYGFVELSNGSGDAFLHATVLAGIGITTLRPGETLECRLALGQRGPQITEVISVDSSTAVSPRSPLRSLRTQLDRQPLEASVQEMGTVKWYNTAKGFGFIALDGGGKDVFLHASALERAGIMRLKRGPARLRRRGGRSEGTRGRLNSIGLKN